PALADEAAPAASVPITADCAVRFATVAEGQALLARRDAFVDALGPLERQIRMASAKPISNETLLADIAADVRPWDEAQTQRLTAAWQGLRDRLAPLRLPLPKEILLIQISGKHESGAAYTRQNAIVLPAGRIQGDPTPLLAHELFHVMSRHDAALRAKLYALIGFQMTEPIALPPVLAEIHLTNPDAPQMDAVIQIEHDGRRVAAAPVLVSRHEQYDPRRPNFFAYLDFKLLLLEASGAGHAPLLVDGRPVLVDGRSCRSYLAQLGGNTNYVIHPDEVMADNFVYLVLGRTGLASPQLVDKMRALLVEAPQQGR
ncbi:MAG: hypothetical protein KDA41_01180, partial [Planctomycetales bacterium]|nr:hypothetical protein [Planctomycetales bacterium]